MMEHENRRWALAEMAEGVCQTRRWWRYQATCAVECWSVTVTCAGRETHGAG